MTRRAVGTAAAVLAFVLPSAAGANVDSASMSASVSPVPFSLTAPSGVSLSLGYEATYSGGFNPVPTRAVLHFDNDIAFDTAGLGQCAPGSISVQNEVQAAATCPTAKVGSGSAVITTNTSTLTGIVTAFNGTQVGSHDSLLLHIALYNGAIFIGPEVWVGEMGPSSRGGDFGTQIGFDIPITSSAALTHLAVTLDNLEPAPGHHYVSARCSDLNRILDFAADFTYEDASTRALSAAQSCPPTGRRAKALKKCKKKHSKKARKKCRKKAKKLPV